MAPLMASLMNSLMASRARRGEQFTRSELAAMLSASEMRVVPPGTALSALWPRVWELSGVGPGNEEISDGMELWWLASQCGAEQLVAPAAPSELADEALSEWLKFFARGEFD